MDEWHESVLPLGGQGCPEVREFAVTEFAAALGRTTESGRRYLSQAVEGFYRLKACWARLVAGDLPAWKLARSPTSPCACPRQAAAFVDARSRRSPTRSAPPSWHRLIEEAKARFDPEALEAERLAAAEAGHFDVGLADVACDRPGPGRR